MAWLGAEEASGRECTDCTRSAKAELNGFTYRRGADALLVEAAEELGTVSFNTGGDQDPLMLHPEGPVLERQGALCELAWGLTQLAKRYGVGLGEGAYGATPTPGPAPTPPAGAGEEAKAWAHILEVREEEERADFRDRRRTLYPEQVEGPLWRSQELTQEALSEVSATVQESYGMTIDGGSLTPTPLIYFLDEAEQRRRWLPSEGRRWGPRALLWCPFRYAAAIPRILAFEAALGVLIFGGLLLIGGLSGASAMAWHRAVVLGAFLTTVGACAVGACAAGVEDWGLGLVPPIAGYWYGHDEFSEEYEIGGEPIFLSRPQAPGPLRGWEWGDWARRASCPLCTRGGRAPANLAFHN